MLTPMGILDRFRRGRDMVLAASETIDVGRPTVLPPDNIAPTLTDMMGLTNYGANHWWAPECRTARGLAMSVPAVRRGVGVIADPISKMPLQRWRDGQIVPEASTYLAQPEAGRAYVTTMALTVQDLIFYPYAWWMVETRDWTGRPATVVRLDPEFVTVEREWSSGEVIREWIAYRGREVPPKDLIRFDSPDAGLLELGAGEIWTALKLEMAAQVYASPEIPSGYLKNTGQYEADTTEIQRLLDSWRIGMRKGSTRFLNANVDYVSVMSTPEALQLVQGREESALQLSRSIGIPARYVNASDGSSMTYSTSVSERLDLVDFSLGRYMLPIEQRLSMNDANGTPAGTKVAFDVDAFVYPTPRERAEINEILIRTGQRTINETRAREGLPPLPAEPQQESADAS